MTEKLATLLHEAAEQDFAALDPTTITRAGDKAVRRRRVLTGVAGVAAVAVVAGGVTALVSGSGDEVHIAGDPGIGVTDLTWVEDSVLHWEDESVDLGHQVRHYVRTSVGFAFVDDKGVVRSYVDGEITEIGQTVDRAATANMASLVADAEGSLVGWVDSTGANPAFVVHDLVTGTESRFDEHTAGLSADAEAPPGLAFFFDIDDGTAYWLDARGTVAFDLATGEDEVLAGVGDAFYVTDVEAGHQVRLAESPGGGDLGLEVVDLVGNVVVGYEADLGSVLSPGARWVTKSEQAAVHEVATGQQVALEIPGNDGEYFDGVVYEWLDADTVAVLHEPSNDGPLDLLTCEVPAGDCTVVASVDGTEGIGMDLVLPGRGWSS